MVKLLVDRAAVEARILDRTGRTPLARFIGASADIQVVQMLLDRNDVGVGSEDKYGWDILRLAMKSRSFELEAIRLLVNRLDAEIGSDSYKDRFLQTMLLAESKKDSRVVEVQSLGPKLSDTDASRHIIY